MVSPFLALFGKPSVHFHPLVSGSLDFDVVNYTCDHDVLDLWSFFRYHCCEHVHLPTGVTETSPWISLSHPAFAECDRTLYPSGVDLIVHSMAHEVVTELSLDLR